MKKYFLALIAILAINFASAQTVTPRWGNNPAVNDNTYRSLSLTTTTVTPTSTLVTIAPKSSYYNLISIASTSISPTFTVNVTKAYYGDELVMFVTPNSTGTRTITLSTNIIGNATTTQTLAASKQAYFKFVFDGAKYQETSRSIQP